MRPAQDHIVLHQLLPRLSWNPHICLYHNTEEFQEVFSQSADQIELLQKTTNNLIFSHQQNNDVNDWLYKNHRKTCEKAGISFEIYE